MSARSDCRAFAMPMVLALVVVVGVMSAVMLERQSAQRMIVSRQLGWYQEHHARLGLQEGIEAWLRALPSGFDVGAALPADGHFLDLELRDGTRAVVFLHERQNAVLTDLAAVEDASVDAAAAIADAVALAFGEQGPPDGLRTVGPAALSAHTASPELLQIAAAALIGDSGSASLFATSLINDRESNGGQCTPSAIGAAAAAAGVENETRALLSRMFTVRPTLYYSTVELRGAGQGPPLARYGGYFVVGTSRGATGPSRSAFLTWEKLGVE
ncbi:MAG TPA: hypothetical protein VFF69_12270 [Phycisphaerales bacterium]|nr:hypothetical protein [Phycisphaerales bacterium]